MNRIYFLPVALVLLGIELIYFRLARAYGIMDKPNDRSLHQKPTIRGGGIIFPVALLLFYFFMGEVSYYFVIALTMIAIVGLMDDIHSLSRSVRFTVQAVAMLLVFYDLAIFAHAWWTILFLMFVATGTVNAYNFMDGINGITGGYSLVVLTSLLYVNSFIFPFVDNDLLLVMSVALVIFSFFNFRTKAVCFAGDVGSLTIGFAIIYLILKLAMAAHNYVFILFLAVYGTDSVLTVIHRLILRQNIFKAHRLHLYQVVISSTGLPHLPMTLMYMAAQALASTLIIDHLTQSPQQQYLLGASLLILLSLTYIVLKRYYYKPNTHVL